MDRGKGSKASRGLNGKGKTGEARGDNGRGRIEHVAGGSAPPDYRLDESRTSLTPEDSEFFRHLLLDKRGQLLGDMSTMENEALRKSRTDAAGDLSMMPIHMADIGTDAYEQEFTIGLIENGKQVLDEIDAALERLRKGTYGICEATGKAISKARLKAKPWARYCVAYERAQEENGRRRR